MAIGSTTMRLQRFLAQRTSLSRRQAEIEIEKGLVQVNQKVASLGTKVNPKKDTVLWKRTLIQEAKSILVCFHKPRDCMTTRKDPQKRKTIYGFLPKSFYVFKPVGRLDYWSEGLLLLTNDGNLHQYLTHPKYEVQKTYLVYIQKQPTRKALSLLKKGILLPQGGMGRVTSICFFKKEDPFFIYQVTVNEGRKHFIRHLFRAIRHPLIRLKRIQHGPFLLGKIALGKYRVLKKEAYQTKLPRAYFHAFPK